MRTAPDTSTSARPQQTRIPTSVQILSILLYGGFAISVSIVTMAMFGYVGIALAVFLAWQWGKIPALSGRVTLDEDVASLRPEVPADAPRPSGNSSFDAYRTALVARLEQEQTQFEGFLTRLRDAKDKHEFDRFMDDRARSVRAVAPDMAEA